MPTNQKLFRRYFETPYGQEILVFGDEHRVTLCIDKDDDEQVCQLTLDAHDAERLHTLLGEALTSLKAKDERAAA